jgi:hypothetical protein
MVAVDMVGRRRGVVAATLTVRNNQLFRNSLCPKLEDNDHSVPVRGHASQYSRRFLSDSRRHSVRMVQELSMGGASPATQKRAITPRIGIREPDRASTRQQERAVRPASGEVESG